MLVAGGNLIRKVLFPAEILPIVTVLTGLVNFGFSLVNPGGVPRLLPACRWRPAELALAAAHRPRAARLHARVVAPAVQPDGAFPRPARPGRQPDDALVLGHADHLLAVRGARAVSRLLALNPLTHLAVAYQEVLFLDGPFASGADCPGLARRPSVCWPRATSSSIGCAIRSRRKCERADARAPRRSKDLPALRPPQEFGTLKSALLSGGVLRDLRPDEHVRGARRRVVDVPPAAPSASSAATARARARC